MGGRVSELGGVKLRLASWLPPNERYQRRLIPVDPESEVESGDVPGLNANPEFRTFRQRSWVGEGITWWERDKSQYRESSNVRPVSIRDGLELGARQVVTQLSAATFNDGSRFGYGLGKLWAADDGHGYAWDVANGDWDAAVTIGAGAVDLTSLTDGDDATNLYSGHADGSIWEWSSGGTAEHYADSGSGDDFGFSPVLRSYEGQLFALDGDDLYLVDKTTVNTRTIKGDATNGSSSVYLAAEPWCFGRMSLSDKGPVWVQRLDNGQTFLWEYNVASDTKSKLGKLAVDFVFPYSVFHANGFTFVGFRYAPAHAVAGDAYIWFKRGAQDGYIGPIRSLTGSTASKPILIAGVIGDDLMFYFDGAVWAYNMTDGEVYMVAKQTTTGTPEDAVTLGSDIFIGPVTSGANSMAVERFATKQYTTETATIDLGKHDWDYPGIGKILLDITVVTDPLPAGTSIQTAVSVDGGAFTNIGSASATDGETKHTWTVSSSAGSTFTGVEFELRLLPLTTDVDETVTVREVSARATGSDHVLKVTMVLDAANDVDSTQTRSALLSSLKAFESSPAVRSFTDRFGAEAKAAGETYDVTVENVILSEVLDADSREKPTVTVEVQAVALR